MTTDTKTTEAVLAHHLDAVGKLASAGASALPDVLSDYAADAKIFTPQGVFEDDAARKAFFEGMIPIAGPLMAAIKMQAQEVKGEIGYIVWTAGSVILFGTDTFVVRDGKIVAQTMAFHMPS